MSFAASLRSNITRNTNNENEVAGRKLVGKAALAPADNKSKLLRTAMQEVGNKALSSRVNGTKGVKQEPLKPARGLTRQKATLSLKTVNLPTRILPKRKSADKKATPPTDQNEIENDPMETSKSGDLGVKVEDIEMKDVDVVSTAFSADRMLLVDDIDVDDNGDPQLVTEYVNQIYIYLRQLEKDQAVTEDYLANKKGCVIVPKMRTVLVDWLVEVHQQFTMLQETLYMSVSIMDRFLQKAAPKISKKSVQLVGVACMFIASKYEEMYAPEIGDFVYITDNAYTQAQIRQMEIEILKVLNFDMGRPLPLHFLRRNSKAAKVDAKVHTLAKYIMELTLPEYSLVHIPPSKLAAAALVVSLKFFDVEEEKPVSSYWSDTLAYYAMYEWSELEGTVKELIKVVLKACTAPTDAKNMAIRTKYGDKKFGRIATVATNSKELFEDMIISMDQDQIKQEA